MTMDINSAWEELKKQVEECSKCELFRTRIKTVFGEGPETDCRCVIIGEAPGEEEDESGRPFVGRAGQLLTDILEKGGGIKRSSVYIMNVVKCRPPGTNTTNRPPKEEEKRACNDYLEAQLLLLQPDVIVTMGNTPTQWLTGTKKGIMSIRGQWMDWRGIKIMPMYHPSFLLRQHGQQEVERKRETWRDIQNLKAELERLQQTQGGQ